MTPASLPSLTTKHTQEAFTMSTTMQETGALQIWVADDDADDHLLFSLAAAEADIDLALTFSLNGLDLLEALASTPADQLPDLVMLDLRMPGLGGHRTLELMREDAKTARVPVVVFTTSTRDADREAALEAGANFVVVKPIRFSQMVDFAASLGWRASQPS